MKYTGLITGALLASSQLALAADSSAAWWQQSYIGAMATYLEPSDVREASTETAGASLLLGLPLQNYAGWSTQIDLAWNELQRDDFTGHDEVFQLGVDVLRHFEFGSALIPYIVTGLAVAYEDINNDDSTLPSLGLGAGFDWQPTASPLVLRAEARAVALENDYERAGQSTSGRTLLVDGRFGLGALWAFGHATVAPADGDADGVLDEADLCPDSLPGAQVDRTGCESLANKDSDGDGVSDASDRCPATPPGEVVDELGCGEQAAVLLEGVNFALNSDVLDQDSRMVLRPIASLLSSSLSTVRIEIAGHTDNLGDDDYNQALSARRAYAVKNFLVDNGISAERLVATGYGASQPVADNNSELGRSKNRRVVFRVIN
ncbi:MAG: OmpA family protein [Oceanococcus sp.]